MVHRPLLRLLLVVGLGKVHAAVVSEPAVLFPTAPSTTTTTTTASTRYSPIALASFYSTNASFSAVELDSTISQDTAILTGSSSSSSSLMDDDDDNDMDHQLHLHYQQPPQQHYQWNHVQNVFLHEATIVPTLLLTILVISAIVMTILLQPDDDDDDDDDDDIIDCHQEEQVGYNSIVIPRSSNTRTDLPVRIPVRPRCPLSPRMETIPELDQQQQPRCFMRRLSSSNGDDIESNSRSHSRSHRRDHYQAAFGRSLTN